MKLLSFALLWVFLAAGSLLASEQGNRVEINFGNTPWKFLKADAYPQAKEPDFDDSAEDRFIRIVFLKTPDQKEAAISEILIGGQSTRGKSGY